MSKKKESGCECEGVSKREEKIKKVEQCVCEEKGETTA